MARDFTASDPDYGQSANGSAIITPDTVPATYAVWAKPDVLSGQQYCLGQGRAVGNSSRSFGVGFDGTSAALFIEIGITISKTVGTASTGTWHHIAARHNAAAGNNTAYAYLDGTKSGAESGWDIYSNTDLTAFLLATNTLSSGTQQEFDGSLAWPTIWNVELTDAEVQSLADGVHPFLIRPASIVAHWPLGIGSPERDVVGGYDFTLTSSPAVAESPMVSLAHTISVTRSAPAVGGGASYYSGLSLMGVGV